MFQLSSFTNTILNTAGDYSKSNAATTMCTTGLGFVRTGMVPLDKKSSIDEKTQVATWMLAATILSIVTQATVYKSLGGILDGVNIKNFKLSNLKNEFLALKKLPLDRISEAINKDQWKAIKKAVISSYDLKNPEQKKVVSQILRNLNTIAKKTSGSSVNVPKETIELILKNLKSGNIPKKLATEYASISKLPISQVENALKSFASSTSQWKNLRKSILKAFDMKNPEERKVAKELFKNLNAIAKKYSGSLKGVKGETTQKILDNVKKMRGSSQFFMYLFGAALFTGYVIPTFIVKYLPNIINFLHENVKINGKPIVPKPKQSPDQKEKKSNFRLFGVPLLASGGLLGFLRYHKLNMEKGLGKLINKTMSKLALWDYGMNPNGRIVRNIFTNAVLRPYAALTDGRIFLAAYNFIIELLSAGSLLTTKKVLGSATNKSGLVGKTIKGLKIVNPKHKAGVEFIMTQGIQTFLVLGVILGLTTNVLSRHLSNFLKNTLNLKDAGDNKNEVSAKNFFPASVQIKNIRGNYEVVNHPILTQNFEEFLQKTGNVKKMNQKV